MPPTRFVVLDWFRVLRVSSANSFTQDMITDAIANVRIDIHIPVGVSGWGRDSVPWITNMCESGFCCRHSVHDSRHIAQQAVRSRFD
jgi:hypothetical protein